MAKVSAYDKLTSILCYMAKTYPKAISPTERECRTERQAMRLLGALRIIASICD